ncbi:hypothetical protein A4A49_18178 [Nicotiana attenuata]|uniref:Uncharacterized protein n=1 Tax=Nicotiana attenuata TaxID=49451 RepID=A0A314KU38_NICAT|nr:hypothetical protein A4A49_18178 [Nicotiana attenuata]
MAEEGRRPSFKLTFFLIALFVTTTVNLTWLPKIQVMALRELSEEITVAKRKLVSPNWRLITCLTSCTTDNDCSDGWLCTECVPQFSGATGTHKCDVRTG